jgi:hypothetical protein
MFIPIIRMNGERQEGSYRPPLLAFLVRFAHERSRTRERVGEGAYDGNQNYDLLGVKNYPIMSL